jgi:hypothetical protein
MSGSSPPLYHPGHDSGISLNSTNAEDSAPRPADENYSGGNENLNYEMNDDEYFNDNDSALGGSLIGYDTHTIASYMTDYRYENGRRYHAYRDGEYWVFSFLVICSQAITHEGTER